MVMIKTITDLEQPMAEETAKRVNGIISELHLNNHNWPFRNSKKDWVLVYTLLKLHLIKKINQPPEISLKN